ncbi:MAG TPA: peptidoglycan bridge formation glycyltransferase FemA/FemB family protein [Alphaproteobacteria bacterium]|jgi:lipid II:glycine glycyltransferase (peptidoglycan interpeptide bridge formation enzyme)|nr:peptidoglycan bridge formation glycyltransferase FemA/FemB family protein [Alphaproteobacteria bacterium]
MNNLDKLATHPLQTSFWAEFRRAWGNEVLETEFGIITLHKIPFLNYKIGIFEKGPTPTKEMLIDLKKIGKENKLIFIKLEPNVVVGLPNQSLTFEIGRKLRNLLKENGAVPGKTLFTPTTFWIDLRPAEQDILKSFSSKTRYNIRLAIKNGVTVKEDNSPEAFEKYLQLTKETVTRQGFFAHTEKYHRLMWKHLHSSPLTVHRSPIAHLMTATYNGEIITTWILFVWKNFLYYPYGASTEQHKNVMANNLMMWEAIKFGKKLGLTTFDLWGREEGKGFTKFKEGYNPKVIEFLGTWDLVINKPLYEIYKFAEKLRWITLKTFAKFGLSKARF